MHILWRRTDIGSYKLSAKVSLVLDNPFPVPSLCKLNHISVCFIQISMKVTCKELILFRENHVFFEVIRGVLGHSVNFNITWRFLLRRPVFPDYSFPCAYAYVLIIYIFKKNKKCQVEHAEKKKQCSLYTVKCRKNGEYLLKYCKIYWGIKILINLKF